MSSTPTRKKAKLSAHPELEARGFDVERQKVFQDFDECQNALDSLNRLSADEVNKIEQKYNKLYKPHYDRRAKLIEGVPDFWAKAFTNHPELAKLLTNDDEKDCFYHLDKIEVEESDDCQSGYRMEFHFLENPYFYNRTLAKHVGGPTLRYTEINWKEGMSLAPQREVSQKRKLNNPSFFEWYSEDFDPSGDKVADIIKDDLWKRPMAYFRMSEEDDNSSDDEDEIDETTPVKYEEPEIPQMDNQLFPVLGASTSVCTKIECKEEMSLCPKIECKEEMSLEPQHEVEWHSENLDPTGDKVAVTIKDETPIKYFLMPDLAINNSSNDEDEIKVEIDEITPDEYEEPEMDVQLFPVPEDPLAL